MPPQPRASTKKTEVKHSPLYSVVQVFARFHAWKTQHQYLGRYSVEKLCAFHHYQSTVSSSRVATMLLLAPLPPFFVLLSMDLVPMKDPRLGPAANGVAFARSVVYHAVLSFMILLSTKQALHLGDRYYSLWGIARIGIGVSIATELLCIPAAFVWRFPVPFREVTAILWFGAAVLFFNWWFGREELKRKLAKLRYYLPMVIIQLSTFYCFLSLAAAFAYISATTQIILVAAFPLIKMLIKRVVWSQARRLDDLSTDVTICFVELTGALYQTVCLQYAKSQSLQLVILIVDALQALYEVRAYVLHEYITDGVSTVQTAVRIVISGVFPRSSEDRKTRRRSETAPKLSLIPQFQAGTGSSVFIKPRMIKTMQSLRLLDLKQYRFDVDAQSNEEPQAHADGDAPTTTTPVRGSDSVEVSLQAARGTTEADVLSASASPELPNTDVSPRDKESTRRGRVSVSFREGSVSSPTAGPIPSSAKRYALPPLQHKSSTLGRISLHEVGHSNSNFAFSVYDPVPPPAQVPRNNSLIGALIQSSASSTDLANGGGKTGSNPRIVNRSDSIKHRPSKRGGAVIHPGSVEGVAAESIARHDDANASPETPPMGTRRQSETRQSLVEVCDQVASAAARGEKPSRVMIDGIPIERKDQARVLEQTLQLLFSCEVLVFAEFFEVVLPSVYGLVVGVLWHLHNARYNLLFIGMSRDDMLSAVSGSFAYAALESLSMCMIAVVMKRRYGISVFHLLGFILENYWKVLYGKMTGALIVVWLTLTVHQGVDFTFTYDYGVILERLGAISRWS